MHLVSNVKEVQELCPRHHLLGLGPVHAREGGLDVCLLEAAAAPPALVGLVEFLVVVSNGGDGGGDNGGDGGGGGDGDHGKDGRLLRWR